MASEMPPDPFEELSGSPPPASTSQHKSWNQIRLAVKKTRRLATSAISRVPHSFTFRHIQTENGLETRLYFLGVPPGNRENTLLYVNVPQTPLPSDQTLSWQMLLESFHATPMHGQFSKEEQLLRERKRLGSFGITSYDYLEEVAKFVFPACSSLYLCNDTLMDGQFVNVAAFPIEVKSSSQNTRLDPKLCPSNPDLLAFISGNDIWVANLQTGHERRLTHAHKGDCPLVDDPLSAGVPSFVVQEEFDRYTGYWWQPGRSNTGESSVYRILYEEVDESDVEILQIASSSGDSKGDEYRYPRSGTPNARSKLKILEFQIEIMGDIINIVEKQLATPLEIMFPSMEYIPRIGWLPDGQSVYAEILDRPQLCQQLIAIPLSLFVPWVSDDVEMTTPETASAPCPVHVLYEDKSDIWINVHDILHFLPCDQPSQVRFIWSSEKSGFRHLYLVTARLSEESPMNNSENNTEDCHFDSSNSDGFKSRVVQEVALTSGEWEVSAKQLWVNEDRKLVFFIGLKDTPMESHLYVVSYENPGNVTRLTELGVSHTIEMDKLCSMFVSVYSQIDTPPSSTVYRLEFTEHGNVIPQKIGPLLQKTTAEDYNAPELFNYQSEAGHTMYGMVFRPTDLEPGQRCPTVLVVYGGPQVQMVTNSYKGHRFLRLHTLTALGYAVVVVDSRGSAHRGLHFESHIKHRLGTVEIADQVEGLMWIASKVDFIDLNRVAIHGWSYGGYLSLMGLAQRPDVFKVAIAGAPVTSWMLYDTGYTERYMDTPHRNGDSYIQGSVLEYVDKLPSEGNRLMIVHGLIDENVHFFHTTLLINALVKSCKPYQLQVYPNERHGIRNPDASEHYETMVLNFLQQNL